MREHPNHYYLYPYDFLEVLECKLEHILSERGEDYFFEIDKEVSQAVSSLTYSELANLRIL